MIRWLILSSWLLVNLFTFATQAEESLVVLSGNTPVFSEFQDDGTVNGYSVDYARAILNAAGIEAEVTPLPFARLIERMKLGERLIATGIGRTAERENNFYWLAPLTANVIGIYGPKPVNIEALSNQNKTLSISVMRGDYRAQLGREYAQFDMVEYNTWGQAIGAVLKGRVDAVFFSEFGMDVICKQNNLDCTSLSRRHTHNIQYSYIAMPKTKANKVIADRLTKTARAFAQTPAFDKLVQRWLPTLTEISADANEIEGVIALGRIEKDENNVSKPWVITKLEPLFSERSRRGKLKGYAVELVQSILRQADLSTEILTAPWQRIFVESAMKPDVLVFSLARTPEREDAFHWITPITQNAYSVFVRADYQGSATSLEELPKGSRIAVLKGDFRQELVKAAGHLDVPMDTWAEVVMQLTNGHADYLFLSDGGTNIICDGLDDACEGFKKLFTYQKATTYLAMSKQGSDQTLLNKLKFAADTFKQSEDYRLLYTKWLNTYSKKTSLNMFEQNGVIVLGKLE
ncbi:MAG: hypothetical protein AXW14_15695 [Alteromonas sp. Nap_26]|nr:MAG: hypothetical protein AXW14_15695 [Alteromonas sp. Nap_26]